MSRMQDTLSEIIVKGGGLRTTPPKVSVLIPVYNGARHLMETIQSVLDQTLTDFELLLCDDGSTDDSVDIALSYDDPRIKVLRNEKNLGNGGTRNRLMREATGEYCAMLDHDDVSYPDRLEIQARYLDEHPEIDLCAGVLSFIDDQGNPTYELASPLERVFEHEELKAETLLYCAIAQTTMMFRRQKAIDNNLKYESGGADDMSFYRDAIEVMRFIKLPVLMTKYRMWDGQFSSRLTESQRQHAVSSLVYSHERIGMTVSEEDKKMLGEALLEQHPTGEYLGQWERYALRLLEANNRHDYAAPDKLYSKILYRHKANGRQIAPWHVRPYHFFRYKIFKKRLRKILKAYKGTK